VPDDLDAIHVRHHQIAEYDINCQDGSAEKFDGLSPACGFQDGTDAR
jgi:hypothetical protein